MINAMTKAIFLEGIDGTGKSTLAKLLKDHLEARGQKVVVLREPGGSEYYEAIRQHIHFSSLERSALSDALTCAGGIAENIRETKRALENGYWVISDRCYISNAVYQIAQGLSPEIVDRINQIALDGFSYDIGILLDVPIEVAEKRLLAIDKKRDRWESMSENYFKTVRQLYLDYANTLDLPTIDASQPIETILAQIIELSKD